MLHVVQLLEPFDQSQHLLGVLALETHGRLGNVGHLGGLDRHSPPFERPADPIEVVRRRRDLEDGCVVTKGQDGQLVLFPTSEFEARAAEVREGPKNRGGRRFSRTVFSGADLQELDKSGRVLVKPDLRTFASLEAGTEIAVIGVYDHVELWNKELYIEDRAEGDRRYLEEDE